MPSYLPDADRDGGWNLVVPNGSGKVSKFGLPAGASPIATWRTAGFGAQIVAADGVTVILSVPETGFVPGATTFVQLTPTAAAPAGMTEGGIWYSSVDHSWHGLDNGGDTVFVTQ